LAEQGRTNGKALGGLLGRRPNKELLKEGELAADRGFGMGKKTRESVAKTRRGCKPS